MKPAGDDKTFITHYEYTVDAVTVDIPPENIIHFRYGMDAENPRKGRSPLSALLQEVFTDQEAADFTATLLGNMGVPGLIVSPKSGTAPADTDVQATKDYLKESHTGSRRGEPLVMSGPTSVTQFGFSPNQMGLREIRRIPEERVTAALGVPAIVAGLGAGLDRSTFANYAEAREAAYQDCIIPAQRMISEFIRFQLLPDFEPDGYWTYRFGFDLSGVRVLQEDVSNKVDRLDVGIRGGWVRVAEGRRAIDLEVDDADEIYLRPSTVVEVPVGEAMPAPVPPALSPGGEPPGLSPGQNEPEQPALPPGSSQAPSRVIKSTKRITRKQTQFVVVLNQDLQKLTSIFSGELEASFKSFGEACEETYNHMVPSLSNRTNGHSPRKTTEDISTLARMIAVTLSEHFDDTLEKNYTVHAERVMDQTFATVNSIFDLSGGVTDEVQKQLLLDGASRRGLLDVSTATYNSIFSAINNGNEQGLSPRDIGRSIREMVPGGPYINAGSAYRSEVIARTETRWVQNASSIALYRASDVVTNVVAMDGDSDPECAARDGVEYTFDEAEAEMGEEHPNGTLAFAPIVDETAGVTV